MRVSVIIPTFNESASIRNALATASGAFEVIVVDGGSTDETVDTAERLGARVLVAPGQGRGSQMDLGAEKAAGDVLLFLHADTRLPRGWREIVRRTLSGERTVAGAFSLRIDSPRLRFRVLERAVGLRARRLGLIYGDQALFVRKDSFLDAGAFRKLPLMEDVDCVKRLRKLGTVALCDQSVVTSPRRWDRGGVVLVTVRNWCTLALYFAGVSPQTLYARYYA